ncbi:MAG: hypothetical protein ACXWC7_15040 [Chitinophagaceae bacterium]
MRKLLYISLVAGSLFLLTQCRKNGSYPPSSKTYQKLSYGDSIFYLRNGDYSISPLNGRNGTYTAFPDNLSIDKKTGVVNISLKGADGESQTGMWYRITFKPTSGDEIDTTHILISGITYLDKFYRLSQNDSMLSPIYNGDPANAIPAGNYDIAHDDKFAINAANGQINLKECMRRGYFTIGTAGNGSWKIIPIKYALDDKSNSITNQIDIVLYYYTSMNAVPKNVSEVMQAHQLLTVGLRSLPSIPSTAGAIDNNLPSNLSFAKPRPPCVIIVGN